MNAHDIVEICKCRVNTREFIAPTHTLCVDGTSATRKSSVLTMTGYPVTKVQRFVNSLNPNTFFPSMIGYVASGVNLQNCGTPRFNDRSYLNVLAWYVLCLVFI